MQYIKIGFEGFLKFVIKTSKIFSNIIKCRRSYRWMLSEVHFIYYNIYL